MSVCVCDATNGKKEKFEKRSKGEKSGCDGCKNGRKKERLEYSRRVKTHIIFLEGIEQEM